ncbi:NfeD family protein [Leekyejoonella antrihumi]|uniref:Serine protease n=1 Tax=Leekyejoonella antrihumi TaxID=1660198 RepID=A0A563E5N7_9MICO|nr:NfeD family protein [Leekyejoonella antrihumi]TWP37860.1 serine protease [Leekyejoonella antrihumi]
MDGADSRRSTGLVEGVIDVLVLGAIVVLIGLISLVIEAHVSTAGVLGAVGVLGVAGGIGAILAGSGVGLFITIPIAVVLAAAGLLTMAMVAGEVVLARRQPLKSGPEALVGQRATIHSWNVCEGMIAADGTLWQARLAFGWEDPQPTVGQTVVINELDGLTLSVRRPTPWEVQPTWKPSSLSL